MYMYMHGHLGVWGELVNRSKRFPVLKAGHPGVLVIYVFVLFWCGVLGLDFLSSLSL